MDHYRTLGVKRTASKHEIEKAYKKLALKCHPDKSDAPDAADKFRLLSEAYEVLKDNNKRDCYDRFDLSQASVGESGSHHNVNKRHHHRHHRTTHHDESFYTGRSEAYRKEREQQDELDRIRDINKRLLEEANAELSSGFKGDKRDSTNRSNSGLYSHIMPELDDDEFERRTLERFRSMAAGNTT